MSRSGAGYVPVTSSRVYAHAFGAKGDGITDDTAAIQAAINAAGPGGTVSLGKGTFGTARFLSGPLTMLDYQTLDGESFHLGAYVGPTDGNTAQLVQTGLSGAQTGLTLGSACRVANLLMTGPLDTQTVGIANSTAAASGAAHSAQFDNVAVNSYGTNVALTSCFYARFTNCNLEIAGAQLVTLANCNNVTFVSPRLWCANSATANTGIPGIVVTGGIASLNIFGGAVEQYGSAGAVILPAASNIAFCGVYWESGISGAVGITTSVAVSKITALLTGNYVNLSNHNRWADLFKGAPSTLVGQGNRFTCTASGSPIAYVLGNNGSNSVDLRGDSWIEVSSSTAAYVDVAGKQIAGHNINPPAYGPTDGNLSYLGRTQVMPASVAAVASARIPHGVAPTAPVNGDLWTTTAGMFVQINGVTRSVNLT